MAYDRYDTRGSGSRERWRSDDRYSRERGDDRSYGRSYDRERGLGRDRYGRGRDDDRGFFERAGDEVASWFGDEEAERRRRRDERMSERDNNRDRDRGDSWFGWGRDDEDYRGDYRRDYDREQGRDRGWFGRDDDRDYRRRDDRESDDRYGVGRIWGDDPGPLSSEGYRSGPPGSDRASGPGYGSTGSGDHDYQPMAGDYGRFDPAYRDMAERGHQDSPRERYRGDREYAETRRRHMEEFDRDYDEYSRDRQSRFESDFGSWRERRQEKRGLLGQIRERMDVVGKDDRKVGTVDRVAGDRIIIADKGDEPGKGHHSLSCTDVDRVEKDKVILDLSADEARERWRDDDRERALFERDDQGQAGPRMLDRSFSGTYRDR